jgi:hypothetical protein
MGLPHSTTLVRFLMCHFIGKVLECGSLIPLSGTERTFNGAAFESVP